MDARRHTLDPLQKMIGPSGDLRPGQWEAIEAIAMQRKRVLVVQRTGWGKSLVYFLATRLLREAGAGPTLLISPLLSLMRNLIEMAGRIGIRAATINSANQKEWEQVEDELAQNACDMILISPERLNNEHFTKGILPKISGRIGLFVVDEAHCISDWGHDFRPDYRRITRILQILPNGIPVLGTTATANNRVVADVQAQLGQELILLRGPLTRKSLRLQNITLSSQNERMAWLVENLPKFNGSGIIYCLTYVESYFSDELIEAATELIRKRWRPDPAPAWVTAIPSCRHPMLVFDLARRLAHQLRLSFCPVLQRSRQAPEQKTMQNSVMQARNVYGTICVAGRVLNTPVLLVDDILDSGWTLAMAGYLLRQHGSGVVHPFTLAQATSRNK